MKVLVERLKHDDDSSISTFKIDGKFECFGVEDEPRVEKVAGESRVQAGIYNLGLRTEGGMHPRYKAIYGDMHKGMICIYNAPDWKLICPTMSFQYVYIHTGNTDDHTEACYLTNMAVNSSTFVGSGSKDAYKIIYPKIADAILSGEEVTIEYRDLD